MDPARAVDTRQAEVIQVIRTVSMVGTGVGPNDPVRNVTSYWTLDGKKLASTDPFADLMPDSEAEDGKVDSPPTPRA